MNHWMIAPVVLPALVAPLIAYLMRYDQVLARVTSVVATLALLVISIGLAVQTTDGQVRVYHLGNWDAPFGIVLVLDRLSALLLVVTSALALLTLVHAIATDWDRAGRHFHALFQFQLMGISGAFLTGDAFNLFVFFEVLLIASYGLMIHGGGRARLRAGVRYVVMNLAGSTLFLFALGTLYAVAGTLNMADLAVKVREMPLEEAALLRVAAILLMVVFSIKAALFPVQFWLPGTYANAPAPVAALFAIMTKVGAYALIRMYITVFGPDVPGIDSLASDWLMPAAVITLALGAVGVMGARRLMTLVSFAVIVSMGTLMLGVSAFTPVATSASLYYLVHSTFAAAALFMLCDLVVTRRSNGDALFLSGATPQNGLFAALFFAGAIAIAGLPPLSGFLGKLMILQALFDRPWAWLTWAVILIGSLLTIIGFSRAGSLIFWKSATVPAPEEPAEGAPVTEPPTPASAMALAPTFGALALLAAMTVLAGPMMRYTDATAQQLFEREGYVGAVLGPREMHKTLHHDDAEHGEGSPGKAELDASGHGDATGHQDQGDHE
ncbi:monovalent cation/H+ antiporter subunit D [Pseudooceanicola algae]|uniref:NAD(P)H-quinone oxidoreductase subunit 2 n=1 Tax=Pseudooceanicola algae TaxID=1537215 RepID=A0A418SBU0_9RHOB|nr:monovalent cation/H+ antiporter subunit D [Pseudooceanicola algae]QPM92537.1 NAD(P)H-quinone oxidoreductase subunit 2 [Pseudooceanicola algae]